MSKKTEGDISNAELLEAVNAGFTAMQQQIDTRFGGLEQKVGGLEQKVGGLEQKVGGLEQKFGGLEQKVGSLEQKVDTLIEENASEHALINRKLDSAITRLDSHDRRLEVLEAVPAFDVEDELKEE